MEGSLTTHPFMLENGKYSYWKARMKDYIKSIDKRASCSVLTGWQPPMVEFEGGGVSKSELKWIIEEERVLMPTLRHYVSYFMTSHLWRWQEGAHTWERQTRCPRIPKQKNVLFVDGLKSNLVSISQLCDQGMLVNFTKDKCQVSSKSNEKIIKCD
ncbi:hypothetical protein J1N35_001714 [Gossypium stocksii]|uniref:DUF4219 domain-containing protein n=1 Tax=Gossypium stocksii TaxID=47602 RepID=A0A9D4ALM1_9ROSI|nr:hypothetical protein J1N35_001714 [Gossypium stocksii]